MRPPRLRHDAAVRPRGRGGPRRLRRPLACPTAVPARVALAVSWHAGGTRGLGQRKFSFFSSNLSGVDGTRNPSESPIRRALRGSEGSDTALPFPANPAIPRDLIPGQRARTAAEKAIALALKEMSPEDRRA